MTWYAANGYFDVEKLTRLHTPFVFVIGGRGTGKTFGALKYVRDAGIRFVYLRRTQTEIDLISQPAYNPYKPITNDVKTQKLTKYTTAFVQSGDTIGYAMALSTIAHIRGFDASDIQVIIYDEFIPEPHARPIKAEGSALLNCYETINRNRELQGQQPVSMWCFANANRLNNPVFADLGLIDRVVRMQDKGITEYTDSNRGITIILLTGSPISERKRDTALYRLVHDTGFDTMALDNRLITEGISIIGTRPIKEYKLLCQVGELCLYKHKAKPEYYVTTLRSGSAEVYTMIEADLMRFRRKYHWLLNAYLQQHIVFESNQLEYILTDIVF